MLEMFNNPDYLIRVTWYLALISTLIFLGQTLMLFFGGDHDADHDIDHDIDHDVNHDHAQQDTGATFQWFTFKNMIAFLMFFAWGVIGSISYGKPIAILIGFLCGLLMVVVMTTLYYYVKKLQQTNIPKMDGLIGKIGKVYLRIPTPNTGSGKITVTLNGSLQTIDAESIDKEHSTGSTVKICSIKNGNIAMVQSDE